MGSPSHRRSRTTSQGSSRSRRSRGGQGSPSRQRHSARAPSSGNDDTAHHCIIAVQRRLDNLQIRQRVADALAKLAGADGENKENLIPIMKTFKKLARELKSFRDELDEVKARMQDHGLGIQWMKTVMEVQKLRKQIMDAHGVCLALFAEAERRDSMKLDMSIKREIRRTSKTATDPNVKAIAKIASAFDNMSHKFYSVRNQIQERERAGQLDSPTIHGIWGELSAYRIDLKQFSQDLKRFNLDEQAVEFNTRPELKDKFRAKTTASLIEYSRQLRQRGQNELAADVKEEVRARRNALRGRVKGLTQQVGTLIEKLSDLLREREDENLKFMKRAEATIRRIVSTHQDIKDVIKENKRRNKSRDNFGQRHNLNSCIKQLNNLDVSLCNYVMTPCSNATRTSVQQRIWDLHASIKKLLDMVKKTLYDVTTE